MRLTPLIHPKEAFEGMRAAGALASATLDYIEGKVVPGITTKELDEMCYNFIVERGGKPACLGYKNYPATICTSVNEVICHGIPSRTQILNETDFLNIDVTVIVDGWHGDTSRMYFVSKRPTMLQQKLSIVAYKAMLAGILKVKPGNTNKDICNAIGKVIRESGFTTPRNFVGHGIGKIFHDPSIVIENYENPVCQFDLVPGMFFTIEPLVMAGGTDVEVLEDEWTVVASDGKLSTQWEHTVGVTEDGVEVFTLSPIEKRANVLETWKTFLQ